jgi:hypothetical protein
VLDESGSLDSFLDATIARTKQMGNTAATPVSSPESRECPSDDLEEAYIELNDKLSPDAKFATSLINIREKD